VECGEARFPIAQPAFQKKIREQMAKRPESSEMFGERESQNAIGQ
jgi:hypothetical protein